ncbi:hypothetical protein BH23GEM6_BH23GEM6_06330 [soil metagenome]
MTSTNQRTKSEPAQSSVAELLQQRSQVQSWLQALENVGGEVSPPVVDRVRSDYSQRLSGVLQELSGHLEAIRSDHSAHQAELTAAGERLDAATEELEEARLRYMIGEISDDFWGEREPELGDAVIQAEADRDDARAEVARLDDLIRQIEEDGARSDQHGSAPSEPDSVASADAEDAGTDMDEAVSDLDAAGAIDAPHHPDVDAGSAEDEASPIVGNWSVAGQLDRPARASSDPLAFLADLPGSDDDEDTVEQPSAERDDFGFLRDLDRALSETREENGSAVDAATEEDPELFRPQPGSKCPECGYTNDPEAWYCGVCGVDLA